MKLFIKQLILWPKDHTKPTRVIPFATDKINVLTGESGTGKSTISSIIDYCLGSGKCTIPIGMIRDKCEWYGVLLELDTGELLLARHDPDNDQITGKMYIAEGVSVKVPPVITTHNIDVSTVKEKMNNLANIPKIAIFGAPEEDSTDYPSFRDMAAFNFQPQHIVANPYTLFFKADTTQHRDKLKTVFPFVLGSITPMMLVQMRRLRELEREEKFLKYDLEQEQSAARRWLEEIESYYINARRLGLLPNGTDNRVGWTTDKYIVELRTVRDFLEKSNMPEIKPGTGEAYANELQQIIVRENALAEEVGDMSRRLSKLKELGSVFVAYQQSETEIKDRLSSVGWLEERLNGRLSHAVSCPICSGELGRIPESFNSLKENARKFAAISQKVQIAPSKLDVDIQNLQSELRQKEDELQKVRQQRVAVEDRTQEQAKRRQNIKEIYYFAGNLALALDRYSDSGRQSEIQDKLERCRREIAELRAAVNPQLARRRLEAALESISRGITNYANGLQLEHSTENVTLDTKELTVKFKGIDGRTDYLWEVGSGQNWVGYHLATLLAMHEFFGNRADNPVPSFLIIDQPSQVYFPESSWTTLEDQPKSSNSSLISEDIKGVQRIFAQLKSFLDTMGGQFQIIVTEHAGEITWADVKSSVHIVGNWRGKKEDYLIPRSWLDD